MIKKQILFYTTLLLLITAFTLSAAYIDYDLWARLIAGMGVIDGGHVLKQDFLSYTPVHTWYDHEWGSGVIFYAFLKFFGADGLLYLQIALSFLVFFAASKVVKLRTGITDYNILIFFLAAMAAMNNLNHPVRCHMFSFLFFTIFIYILEKVRRKACYKLLLLLPLITLVWNNLHGGVVAGLGLIAMYIAGEIFNRKPYRQYVIALCVSALSLIINPWGIDYIKFLLHATTMPRPSIIEWHGLFSRLHIHRMYKFKLFLFLLLVFEIFNTVKAFKNFKPFELYHKIDKVKLIVLSATLLLAVQHIKMIPFFCIAALCYCYEDISSIFDKISQKAVYIAIILITCLSLANKNFELPLNSKIYPVTEVEFIRANDIKGNILVDFGLGSYTSYKLYPHNKIYMDGRYEEVYPDELIVLLNKFYGFEIPAWDDILKRYPPDIVLVKQTSPIYVLMKKYKGYKHIFTGSAFGVFIREELYTGNYNIPILDKKYYRHTLFNTDIKFSR